MVDGGDRINSGTRRTGLGIEERNERASRRVEVGERVAAHPQVALVVFVQQSRNRVCPLKAAGQR